MVKISTIFGLGILVAFTQFLGLPMGGKDFIYIVSGILIAILATLIRRELLEVVKKMHIEPVNTETFSEGKPAEQTQSQQ